MRFSKKNILVLVILSLSLALAAQELGGGDESDSGDDLFDLFDDTTDIEVEEKGPATDTSHDAKISVGDVSVPLKFTDHLDTELGLGYMFNDIVKKKRTDSNGKEIEEIFYEDGPFAYLSFANYLYMSARASENLSFRGSLLVSFPKWNLDVYELYFDYFAFSRLYITAGRKQTSWGYIRLFSGGDGYAWDSDNEEGTYFIPGTQTDILYDSRLSSSILVRVPVWTGTISAIAMLPDKAASSDPSPAAMSYAGSLEFTVFKTTVNFFGRKYPSSKLENGEYVDIEEEKRLKPVVGIEAKRTVFGFDIYGQGMARVQDKGEVGGCMKSMFKGNLTNSIVASAFSQMVLTAGIYKFNDDITPNYGANFEYQRVYNPLMDERDERFIDRMAFKGGIGRLGPGRNIRFGIEWNHNLTKKLGDVTPAVVLTGIFPHAKWQNGVKVEYGGEHESHPRVSLATTLSFSVDF